MTEARKAAIAKAVEERTAIVEKAEALADSLDENTNWRSTADKFRSLFQQWQEHQRNNVRIDKEDADACGSFLRGPHQVQFRPPQVGAEP